MTYQLRADVSTAETDYGITLLDERSGEYFNLNPTGAIVLRVLLDGATRAEAVDRLTAEYDIDRVTADNDVTELIETLHASGLVTSSSPGAGTTVDSGIRRP